MGYGMRYEYGMFRQVVENGYQVEEPDHWLIHGSPWELVRPEYAAHVPFKGRTEFVRDQSMVSACAGLKPRMWWRCPMTFRFPAITTAPSTRCACGKRKQKKSSVCTISTVAIIPPPCKCKTRPKIFPWSSTPTTNRKTAKNYACASSISSHRLACRTFCAAGCRAWREFLQVCQEKCLPTQRHAPHGGRGRVNAPAHG